MSDLIERQMAIEALCGECQGRCNPCDSYPCSEVDVINALPTQTNTPNALETLDCVERQAVIDEIEERKNANGYRNVAVISELNRLEGYIMRLPSAQPECPECDDAVSREAAIDAALSAFSRGLLASPDIRKLPSAQHEPQWIPVSERLPEEYGNYLISIHGEDEPDIGTINPNDKRGWSLCDANGFHWASDKKLIVTAWKPLPKPYRAERRTDG